jgi:hypothetical protein
LVLVGCHAARGSQAPRDDERARHLASEIDLPLIEEADRVVVTPYYLEGARSKTIADAAELQRIRSALQPAASEPCSCIVGARLAFYRGDRFLRRVWINEGGDWGIERPGPGHTLGRAEALWEYLAALLLAR